MHISVSILSAALLVMQVADQPVRPSDCGMETTDWCTDPGLPGFRVICVSRASPTYGPRPATPAAAIATWRPAKPTRNATACPTRACLAYRACSMSGASPRTARLSDAPARRPDGGPGHVSPD